MIGKGDVILEVPNEGKMSKITLKDALYIPDMAQTMIAASQIG